MAKKHRTSDMQFSALIHLLSLEVTHACSALINVSNPRMEDCEDYNVCTACMHA